MTYQAERWAPLPIPVDVFLIALETTEDLKTLLGASSVRVAYNRGGTILIEWTMMHRETFAGLVGQYIIRKSDGGFDVLDADELMSKWAPVVESKEEERANKLAELGELLAVHNQDGVIDEILFKMPDGTPAAFILKTEEFVLKEKPKDIVVDHTPKEKPQININVDPPKGPSPAEIQRNIQRNAQHNQNNQNKEKNR